MYNCTTNVNNIYINTSFFCLHQKVTPIDCACEHPVQMYLQLRGLCPDSNIDQVYITRNKPRSGKVILVGFKNTIIEYDGSEFGWKLRVEGMLQSTSGLSIAPRSTYALGKHEWAIEGDSLECSKRGEPYTRLLKLTGCRVGEFTCSDGQCISMNKRCDQIVNCQDKSDEENCRLLVLEKSYNKKVPPFSFDTGDTVIPVTVEVSTSLRNVLQISESAHTIDLKFSITLKWFENRVQYNNLKTKEALNVLSDEEVLRI